MKLPKETAALYRVNPKLRGGPVFYFGKHGTVDFSTLTPKRAGALVKAGFPHLSKLEPKPEPKKEKKAEKDTSPKE